MSNCLTIGILTCSDRAYDGTYEDLSGPAIKTYLSEKFCEPIQFEYRLIPDEPDHLRHQFSKLHKLCHLVLTTGGTGPAPRDITPEVTEDFCDRILPGFGEKMRACVWDKIPTSILSRQIAGLKENCLIINLPGKPKAIRECLDAVFGAIPDCLDLIGAPDFELAEGVKAPRHHRKNC